MEMNNATSTKLPLTIVFVDYESWFWGLYNKGGEKPNIKAFIADVNKRALLDSVYFFGDFTSDVMVGERSKMRVITNNIIDCANPETKKDFTDFIMLDYIYQTIIDREDIEQYVLVTGDGHFSSVVAYLKNFKRKQVGVYAVTGTLSNQLRESATWTAEIEHENEADKYVPVVLQVIRRAEEQGIIPTFSKTVANGSRQFGIDQSKFTAALSKLISEGYITQELKQLPSGMEIRALVTNWTALRMENVWSGSAY